MKKSCFTLLFVFVSIQTFANDKLTIDSFFSHYIYKKEAITGSIFIKKDTNVFVSSKVYGIKNLHKVDTFLVGKNEKNIKCVEVVSFSKYISNDTVVLNIVVSVNFKKRKGRIYIENEPWRFRVYQIKNETLFYFLGDSPMFLYSIKQQ